jgi:uncharacterized protein YbaR (Trm112 family)/SAM-dependent methyltransferase
MDIIVCPKCKKRFKLDSRHQESRDYSHEWREKVVQCWNARLDTGDNIDIDSIYESSCTEIINGELICESCGVVYPIENGIPRILSPELRTISGHMGRGNPKSDIRLNGFIDQIAPVKDKSNMFQRIQLANQSNYGYEWQTFNHEYEGWERIYKNYYVSEDSTYFKGKLGFDAGCGMGRYSLVPVSKGAEMVGVDLSNAIEAAYAKSLSIPTFHVIQGDIYNLPFRDNYFDFTQTLGVIHITPDPEEALLSIKEKVRTEGKVFIYVYPNFKDENALKYYLLKLVNQMRKITVKIPSNYLYWLLFLMLPIVLVFLYFPSWVLWHIPGMKRLSTLLPYNYEQYQGRKIRDIHMNLFDRFGNPVERRYSRAEMEKWMNSVGFKKYSLYFKDGWTVSAIK